MLKSWFYRLLALVSASTCAAFVFAAELVMIYLAGDLVSTGYTNPMVVTLMGLAAVMFAAPTFLLGLVVIGGPCWWLLHRIHCTSAIAAAAACAFGSTAVGAIALGIFGLPPEAIGAAVLLAIPGAAAGWVVQAVAYDRSRPPRPRPVPPS